MAPVFKQAAPFVFLRVGFRLWVGGLEGRRVSVNRLVAESRIGGCGGERKKRKGRKSRSIITICCEGHLPKSQTHPSRTGKRPANWEWESLVLVTFHI